MTASPWPRDLARFALSGWSARSVLALALLVLVGSAVGYRWRDLLDQNGAFDPLLTVTWVLLAVLVAWGPSLRRDVAIVAVGLAGGAVIETWGTTTRLWTYFTEERPPLWILPAWPIAALAIDRLARMVEHALAAWERRAGEPARRWMVRAYWVVVPLFVLAMGRFCWPSRGILTTWAVFALMVALTATPRDHRRDLAHFVGGSLLGILLETWGTTRGCWTYHSGETPPAEAVFAHGFAAIAFARGSEWLSGLAPRIAARALGSS